MAASYLRRGMTGTATFSLFVRSLPPARGFLVAAGVESCLDLVPDLRFDDDDIRYLRDLQGLRGRRPAAFRPPRFNGDALPGPERNNPLPREPPLRVTGRVPQAPP